MTKKEIVRQLCEKANTEKLLKGSLTQLATKEIVQWTFDAIIETLVAEGRIELRNFGVFEVKQRKPRKARNPRTGDRVDVAAKNVVTFQPGKEMEERVRKYAKAVETKRKTRRHDKPEHAAPAVPSTAVPPAGNRRDTSRGGARNRIVEFGMGNSECGMRSDDSPRIDDCTALGTRSKKNGVIPNSEFRVPHYSMNVVLDARVVTGSGGGPDKTILNSPRFLEPLGYRMLCAYLHPPDDPGFDALRAQRGTLSRPAHFHPRSRSVGLARRQTTVGRLPPRKSGHLARPRLQDECPGAFAPALLADATRDNRTRLGAAHGPHAALLQDRQVVPAALSSASFVCRTT